MTEDKKWTAEQIAKTIAKIDTSLPDLENQIEKELIRQEEESKQEAEKERLEAIKYAIEFWTYHDVGALGYFKQFNVFYSKDPRKTLREIDSLNQKTWESIKSNPEKCREKEMLLHTITQEELEQWIATKLHYANAVDLDA